MKYTPEEVMQFIKEEDVKFIRMAFCDADGRQRNVAVMPGALEQAFARGLEVDGREVPGFPGETLFLRPDPSTLTELPWRPQHGRVAHMFCEVRRGDGSPCEADARSRLKAAVSALPAGELTVAARTAFTLRRLDENGEPTDVPHDQAGYLDIAPEDRGENVRREICLTLERMGIPPVCSCHMPGPGRHEVLYRPSEPVSAADNAVTFYSVARTIASLNGLWADFSGETLYLKIGAAVYEARPEENPYAAVLAAVKAAL